MDLRAIIPVLPFQFVQLERLKVYYPTKQENRQFAAMIIGWFVMVAILWAVFGGPFQDKAGAHHFFSGATELEWEECLTNSDFMLGVGNPPMHVGLNGKRYSALDGVSLAAGDIITVQIPTLRSDLEGEMIEHCQVLVDAEYFLYGISLYSHPDNNAVRPHPDSVRVAFSDVGAGTNQHLVIVVPDDWAPCGSQLDVYFGRSIETFNEETPAYGSRLIGAANWIGTDDCDETPIESAPEVTVPTTTIVPNVPVESTTTAPVPTTVPSTTTVTTLTELPATGVSTGLMVLIGLILVAAGALVVASVSTARKG